MRLAALSEQIFRDFTISIGKWQCIRPKDTVCMLFLKPLMITVGFETRQILSNQSLLYRNVRNVSQASTDHSAQCVEYVLKHNCRSVYVNYFKQKPNIPRMYSSPATNFIDDLVASYDEHKIM